MPNVSLGPHFEDFISRKVSEGRFQNASEVVRAGLRLLEDQELNRAERAAKLARAINAAYDDPAPDLPIDDAFAGIEERFEADSAARANGA